MNNNDFQIDFSKLPAFLMVAKCLNFTEAAYQLYTSQSSVSKAIASLEDQLGYPLFHREGRKVLLTQEGRYLYENLPKKLDEINEIILNARKINNGHEAILTIGSAGYLPKTPSFEYICSQFSKTYPSYDLEFAYLQASEIRKALLDSKVDAVLYNHHDLKMLKGYKYFPIMRGTALFACNSMLNEKNDEEFDLSNYKDKRFISLSSDFIPSYDRYLIDTCRAYGFEPPKIKYVNSFIELISYISNSDYVSIFDKTIFPLPGSDLTTIEIPYKKGMPTELISIISWNSENENPALEAFVELSTEILKENVSDF